MLTDILPLPGKADVPYKGSSAAHHSQSRQIARHKRRGEWAIPATPIVLVPSMEHVILPLNQIDLEGLLG